MKATKEEMKQEAIKRLEKLELYPTVLSDFKNHGLINVSEHQNIAGFDAGILYWANEEQSAFIKQFEQEHNVVVYHAIYTPFCFGRCLSLLCVVNHKNVWERDNEDLKKGCVFSYVRNIDSPNDSEWGYIEFQPAYGGLIRTY